MPFFRNLISTRSKPKVAPFEPPQDAIHLHSLCSNCTTFGQNWSVLPWLQQPQRKPVSVWPKSRLCSVAHLFANERACHFCKFLLGCLQRSKMVYIGQENRLNIYLHPQSEIGYGCEVRVELAEKTPVESTAKTYFAAFLLKRCDCML